MRHRSVGELGGSSESTLATKDPDGHRIQGGCVLPWRRRIPLVLSTTLMLVLVSVSGSGSAQAKEPTPPPPMTLPPPPTDSPPPDSAAPCGGGWFLSSTYGGYWPTEATWWESPCGFWGAYDESTPLSSYFYYWDGHQAVKYGTFWTEPYMTWDGADPCSYWIDGVTNEWYGPYACTAEWDAYPTASFTFSCSGLRCTFDASGSSDSDGTIVDYSWYFGDWTQASGVTVEHAFATAGTRTVSLWIADEWGLPALFSADVTVSG